MLSTDVIADLHNEELDRLIAFGCESDQLDYKETFDMKNVNKGYLELIKDMVSFANTHGGYLVFGVTDDMRIQGLSEDIVIDSTTIDDLLEKYVNRKVSFIVKPYENKDQIKFIIIRIEKIVDLNPAVFKKDGQYQSGNKSKTVFKKSDVYVRRGTISEPNTSYWFEIKKLPFGDVKLPKEAVLHNLPKPNYGERFVGRDNDIQKILDGLIEEEHTYRILVHGIGGLGKTALTQKVAYTLLDKVDNKELELDYIVWVSAKNEEYAIRTIRKYKQEFNSLNDLINTIINVLNLDVELSNSLDNKTKIVNNVLKDKIGVIIVDNWETVSDDRNEILNFLLRVPGKNKIIITSRHLIVDQQLKNIAPAPMVDEEGVSFIESWRKNFDNLILNSLGKQTLNEIAESAGGIPIAMIMALGQISLGKPLEDVINELKEYEIDDPLLDFCFSETYKFLKPSEKRILLSLTFFEEPISKNTINAMTSLSNRDLSYAIQKLQQFSFINNVLEIHKRDIKERYFLNPITKSFLKTQLISVPEEKELLEENFSMISAELKNYDQLEISSMKSVIDKLEYVSIEDKLAASFAASATRVWKLNQNWKEAKRKFEKAKVLSPNLGYIYGQWAWVCERANEIELARENYHKAVQLDDENIKLWYQWAMFELLKGDYKQARVKFERVLKYSPDDARSWHGLGRVLFKDRRANEREKLTRIEDMFMRGFINNPTIKSEKNHNAINAYYLAKISLEKNNISKVEEYISMGLRLNPTDMNLLRFKKSIRSRKTVRNKVEQDTGVVFKLLKSGAIVKKGEESYFLHISKVSSGFIKDINDVLTERQPVEFKVIKAGENGRLPEIALI